MWQEEKKRRTWLRLNKKITQYALLCFLFLPVYQGYILLTGNASYVGEAYEPVLPSSRQEGDLFGTVTLEAEGVSSLEQAAVLINDEPVAYFTTNQVVVRVYPGDMISLDVRAYSRPITFRLVSHSSNIRSGQLQDEMTLAQTKGLLGTVSFK